MLCSGTTAIVLASILVSVAEGFTPPIIYSEQHFSSSTTTHGVSSLFPQRSTSNNNASQAKHHKHQIVGLHKHSTKLYMSDNKEGPGLVPAIFISGVLLYFVASAFAPLTLLADKQTGPSIGLGDSVVTREDGDKLKKYQSNFDALGEAKIQQKLSNLPVFYTANEDTGMGDNIYLSYDDAKNTGKDVKVTTLDQVMYPLILKRNIKANTNTPVEIKAARASTDGKTYKLISSKAALNDAKDMTSKDGDIPLFVVERLAFAGADGKPELPLFTEKEDAITSYSRLRESGGNKLPEQPSIRTTTLLDVLESMEKGTRPGVGQLQFYGNADDVLKADEMSR